MSLNKPRAEILILFKIVAPRRSPKTGVLDMASSESPPCGEQEGGAYNDHFACTCYHSLFVVNQFGDVERCAEAGQPVWCR